MCTTTRHRPSFPLVFIDRATVPPCAQLYWQSNFLQFSSRWYFRMPTFPTLLLKHFPVFVWRWLFLVSSFEQRSSSVFLLRLSPPGDQWSDVLFCVPAVMSQTPQHFRSSETPATCGGYLARQSSYSVISLDSGMSSTVHPQESSKVDVEHWHMPTGLDFPFHFYIYFFFSFFFFVASSLNLWGGWHV